jgi:hypothetical protein
VDGECVMCDGEWLFYELLMNNMCSFFACYYYRMHACMSTMLFYASVIW